MERFSLLDMDIGSKLYCFKQIGDCNTGKLYQIFFISDIKDSRAYFTILDDLGCKHSFSLCRSSSGYYTNWFLTEKEYNRNALIKKILYESS